MSGNNKTTLRWGIISTGVIATQFCKDLLIDPSTRDVSDVTHKIVAIGSRSIESANSFIDKLKQSEGHSAWGVSNGVLDGIQGYASYEEVYNHPDVDAIYIGTPHNYHYANAKGALLGGKHVLCEKPFTIDLEELDDLIAIAKEKKLFLMEAVWTRFHPIAYKVQEIIHSGRLGKVKRFQADFSFSGKLKEWGKTHRLVNPDLAGGSLLDMGPYPSVWAMLVLFQHPENKRTNPELVSSHQQIYPLTGVDQNSRWLLEWPGLGGVQAALLTDLATAGYKDGTCIVQCEKGDLAVETPAPCPTTCHIIPHDTKWLSEEEKKDLPQRETFHCPIPAGAGMHYEADEVARCVRDGKLQSDRMPWDESRLVQSWFDQVRKSGNSVLKDLKGQAGQ